MSNSQAQIVEQIREPAKYDRYRTVIFGGIVIKSRVVRILPIGVEAKCRCMGWDLCRLHTRLYLHDQERVAGVPGMNTGEHEIHLPAKSKHHRRATDDKHAKAEVSQRLMILPTALRSHTLFTYMKNAGEDITHVKISSESVIVETNLDSWDTWKRGKIISVRFHSDKFVKPWGGVFDFSVEFRDSHGEAVINKYKLQSGILTEE